VSRAPNAYTAGDHIHEVANVSDTFRWVQDGLCQWKNVFDPTLSNENLVPHFRRHVTMSTCYSGIDDPICAAQIILSSAKELLGQGRHGDEGLLPSEFSVRRCRVKPVFCLGLCLP
jgi:hypothetical protein